MLRRSMTRCLALAARERARDERHLRADADDVIDRVELRRSPSSDPMVSENTSGVTSTCTSIVEPVLAAEDDLVVRQRALDGEERGLDLGEHVHAADDEHVVGAAADAADAPDGAAAGALGRSAVMSRVR